MSQKNAQPAPVPTSTLVVRNRHSQAMTPSEVYSEAMAELARRHGDHVYLVLVGPRLRVISLEEHPAGWRLDVAFGELESSQHRVVQIPRRVVAPAVLKYVKGRIELEGPSGTEPITPAVLIRKVLDSISRNVVKAPSEIWVSTTISKLFAYRVEYVGQAQGIKKVRFATDRLADGHEKLQKVLSEIHDYHPYSEVGVIMVDGTFDSRDLHFTLTSQNTLEMSKLAVDLLANPNGPLKDDKLLVDALEGLLVRHFHPKENELLQQFPLRDRPSLIRELVKAGVTHLGFAIDIEKSFAVFTDPLTGNSASEHRCVVNVVTGDREDGSNAPLAFQGAARR